MAVYGLVGVVLQGIALLTLHIVIPGDFHEHVDEPELHPAAFAVGGDAVGRRRGDRRRGVMTSVTPCRVDAVHGVFGAVAGTAAGCRRGVRGLRHRLRTGATHPVGEPERRQHRRHLTDRRGLHRRTGCGRPAGQAAVDTRGDHLHRRRGIAGHHRRSVRGGAVCRLRLPGRFGRVDVGAGREHRTYRRTGRCRGTAVDDPAAAWPGGGRYRYRPHTGQPERGRLPGRIDRWAGLAVHPAAAAGHDPRRGGHRHHQLGGRRRRVDLLAATRRFHPAVGDGVVRARRGTRRCWPPCWCVRTISRPPAGRGFTPTQSSPTGIRPTRRSSSPVAATTRVYTSTAVCSSPPATNTAIQKAWSTRPSAAIRQKRSLGAGARRR